MAVTSPHVISRGLLGRGSSSSPETDMERYGMMVSAVAVDTAMRKAVCVVAVDVAAQAEAGRDS